MNIKTKIPDTRVEFKKLNNGDVFQAENGLYYMKMERCSELLEERNAVSLESGVIAYVGDRDMVQPVEHELIIKS